MDGSKSPNMATVVSAKKMAKGKVQRKAGVKLRDREDELKKVIIDCLLGRWLRFRELNYDDSLEQTLLLKQIVEQKKWFLCTMNFFSLAQNDTYPLDLSWFLIGSTPVITLVREKIYSWESNRLTLNESIIPLDSQLLKCLSSLLLKPSNQPVTR